MAELPCPHMPSSHCLTSLIFFLCTFFKRPVYTHCFHVFTSQPVLNLLKSHLWPYQLSELNFARITTDLHAAKFNGHSSFSKSLGNADSVLSLETLPFLTSMKILFSLLFCDLTDHAPLVLLAGYFFSTQPLNAGVLQGLDLALPFVSPKSCPSWSTQVPCI